MWIVSAVACIDLSAVLDGEDPRHATGSKLLAAYHAGRKMLATGQVSSADLKDLVDDICVALDSHVAKHKAAREGKGV